MERGDYRRQETQKRKRELIEGKTELDNGCQLTSDPSTTNSSNTTRVWKGIEVVRRAKDWESPRGVFLLEKKKREKKNRKNWESRAVWAVKGSQLTKKDTAISKDKEEKRC